MGESVYEIIAKGVIIDTLFRHSYINLYHPGLSYKVFCKNLLLKFQNGGELTIE